MAKVKSDSIIGLELDNFEKKIKQFQKYLETFNIETMEDDKKRHDEIDCQTKIMNVLPNWLTALEKLRNQNASKKIEVRADSELSGLMKLKEKEI